MQIGIRKSIELWLTLWKSTAVTTPLESATTSTALPPLTAEYAAAAPTTANAVKIESDSCPDLSNVDIDVITIDDSSDEAQIPPIVPRSGDGSPTHPNDASRASSVIPFASFSRELSRGISGEFSHDTTPDLIINLTGSEKASSSSDQSSTVPNTSVESLPRSSPDDFSLPTSVNATQIFQSQDASNLVDHISPPVPSESVGDSFPSNSSGTASQLSLHASIFPSQESFPRVCETENGNAESSFLHSLAEEILDTNTGSSIDDDLARFFEEIASSS